MKQLARAGLLFSCACCVPMVLMLIWLAERGALEAYLDTVRNYYPLYVQIGKDGAVYPGGVASFLQKYVVLTVPLLFSSPIVVMASVGLFAASRQRCAGRCGRVSCSSLLLAAALLYIPLTGKFWFYHKIPLFYVLSLCAGLAALPLRQRPWQGIRAVVVLVVGIAVIPWHLLTQELRMWRTGEHHPVRHGMVDHLATELRRCVRPGDTILPLDATYGALHTLYRIRHPHCGRFIYDFHFYHHVDSPYIQDLRAEFITGLKTNPPDFIIQCEAWRPYGPTCSDTFPELEAIMEDYERQFRHGKGSLWHRKQ